MLVRVVLGRVLYLIFCASYMMLIKEDQMKAFFEENGYPAKFELMPYHKLGEHKYEALGKPTESFAVPDKEKIEMLK